MKNEGKHEGYLCDIDHLRHLITLIEKGVEPMMSDLEKIEVQKLYKEMNAELFDDEDDNNDDYMSEADKKKHQEMLQRKLEEEKRKAHKHDVVVIKLNEKQKAQLKEEMSSSIVRPDPNLIYNMKDEDLYTSAELKILRTKLNKLRQGYYNQIEWMNAVKIIKESIEYSLEHDYPWLSKEEAFKLFNEGKIKYKYTVFPKLYVNYYTEIKDPMILKGVMNGDVRLVDKNTAEEKHNSYKDSALIPYATRAISQNEHKYYTNMHKQHYETPISPAIRAKSTIYDRYSTPTIVNSTNQLKDRDGNIAEFDWTRDGAGLEYYREIHGKRTTVNQFVNWVQEANDGKITKDLISNMSDFIRSLKSPSGIIEQKPDHISSSLQPTPDATQIEQDILKAIQMNNPNK